METIEKVRLWVKADGNVEPEYRQRTPRKSRQLLDHEIHLREMYEADLGRRMRVPEYARSLRGVGL